MTPPRISRSASIAGESDFQTCSHRKSHQGRYSTVRLATSLLSLGNNAWSMTMEMSKRSSK